MKAQGPRLLDLGIWSSGGTPPKDRSELWDGDVPWVSGKDFEDTRLSTPVDHITADAARSYSAVMPAGSIVALVRGMALVHGLPVGLVPEDVAINQDVRGVVLRPELEARFVRYALLAIRRRLAAHIDRAAHGTARFVESGYAERLPDPRAVDQRAVADFLDRECERIERLLRAKGDQRTRFDGLRTGVLVDTTRHLAARRLKHGWRVVDCKHRTPTYTESGCPLISTREVRRGVLDVSAAERFVSEEDARDLREGGRDPLSGDIVYSRNATVGVASYVATDEPMCMGQDVVLVTRRPRTSELLALVLNWGVADQVERASVGSTFSRINVETIRNLVVPFDEERAEQVALEELRSRLVAIDAAETKLASSEALLREYRDALITEAVIGQLDVARLSDAQLDESAHAALEGGTPEVLAS